MSCDLAGKEGAVSCACMAKDAEASRRSIRFRAKVKVWGSLRSIGNDDTTLIVTGWMRMRRGEGCGSVNFRA